MSKTEPRGHEPHESMGGLIPRLVKQANVNEGNFRPSYEDCRVVLKMLLSPSLNGAVG